MPRRSCFVIMPIGPQEVAGRTFSAHELRQRYDDLIKEAILNADAELDVVRADDIAAPGTITADILTRLMHSDLVVCDVSFPNPNVFYELGLRHACRLGTVIIKDRNAPAVPFDIVQLRHFEYDNTPTGLKKLAEDFKSFLDQLAKNPDRPDNQFQELARVVRFAFPNYASEEDDEPELAALMALMASPGMLEIVTRKASGEDVSQAEMIGAVAQDPNLARVMFKSLLNSGDISFGRTQPRQLESRSARQKKKGKKGK